MPHNVSGPARTSPGLSPRAGLSLPLSPSLSSDPVSAEGGAPTSRRPGSLLALVVGVALGLAGCHANNDAKGGNAGGHGGAPGGAMPPMPVTVVKVERKPLPLKLSTPGQAEGSREVEVRARVSGTLERKLFEEGDPVKLNQPMYQIDRVPLEIALSQAKAQLAQAQAQFENARIEEARLKPLAERRAVSQREYDTAIATRRSAEAARAAAQSQIRDADLNLSYALVRAPIAGVSGRSLKSEGSLITISSDSLLTTISTDNPIWVRFGLSERDSQKLESGKIESVRIMTPEGQPLLDGGELNFASKTIDRSYGTVQLRATFPNPERGVLPGQFVQVEIAVGGREAWTVPQQAVIQSDQGRIVWVVGAENKVEPRPVQVAEWVGKDWIVTSGLKDGDQVVVDNLIKIRPGATVAPHPPGQGPGAAPAGGNGGGGAKPPSN